MSSARIEPMPESEFVSRFSDLRGVRWRINLGILPSSPSSSIDDLRRVTADYRRRYAGLRRRMLLDPHAQKDGKRSPDLVIDNPLSQSPDSMWGRYFRNAELEKMVDQDLSRLYPEHENYFQTPGCQGMLRRILMLWCLRYPEYGYRQGMHELLAPLLYVLHSDMQRLSEVRSSYEDYFTDKFDDAFFHESDLSYNFDFTRTPDSIDALAGFQEKAKKVISLEELDLSIQTIVYLSDAYGAEGELGIVLSEKFLEHDAYCMFDALMSGAGGAVAMAEFFSHSPASASQTGLPPVIEASSALYHLLSIVDLSLHSHLVEMGVEPQYFALRWFRVLFGREFSLERLLVIWDEIFSFDDTRSVQASVLNSRRGAFISAMAVSMILTVRSSLLATENATSCLQRLLNFPENVELERLIGKAKSLVTVALDANNSPLPYPFNLPHSQDMSKVTRGHSHSRPSFDSSARKTPTDSVPERYWEEKWRVLHKEEELKKDDSAKQASTTPRKSWTQKVKLRLSRAETDPSSKRANRVKDHKSSSSIRRSLLEDLAQVLHMGEEDDTKEAKVPEPVPYKDHPLLADPPVIGQDVQDKDKDKDNPPLYVEDRSLGCQSTCSEDNSPLFSDTGSPGGSNGLENGSEDSSFASNISQEVNDGAPQNADQEPSSISVEAESPPLPVSDPPDADATSLSCCDSSCQNCPAEPSLTDSKARKSVSGKFHWLWKFGRPASAEGTYDKGTRTAPVEGTKSASAASHESNVMITDSANEQKGGPVNVKGDGDDQNLLCTLRSLGQSMLENIQVIEMVFQQQDMVGSLDNFSKHALVEKGQVTAVAALKELRKISHLLSEM
ncbi:hypothetical protein Dimus_002396 [Dionaea muscipula]